MSCFAEGRRVFSLGGRKFRVKEPFRAREWLTYASGQLAKLPKARQENDRITWNGLIGGRGRNRTFNLSIKSRMLCQLSYASWRGDRAAAIEACKAKSQGDQRKDITIALRFMEPACGLKRKCQTAGHQARRLRKK